MKKLTIILGLILLTIGIYAQDEASLSIYEYAVRYYDNATETWGEYKLAEMDNEFLLVVTKRRVTIYVDIDDIHIYDRIGDFKSFLSDDGEEIPYAEYLDRDGVVMEIMATDMEGGIRLIFLYSHMEMVLYTSFL